MHKTAAGVGVVTAKVVLCELGDFSRFRNAKAIFTYSALVPAVRPSRASGPRTWGSPRRARGFSATVVAALRLAATSPTWSARFVRRNRAARAGTGAGNVRPGRLPSVVCPASLGCRRRCKA
jgi:hypothetical protein